MKTSVCTPGRFDGVQGTDQAGVTWAEVLGGKAFGTGGLFEERYNLIRWQTAVPAQITRLVVSNSDKRFDNKSPGK